LMIYGTPTRKDKRPDKQYAGRRREHGA